MTPPLMTDAVARLRWWAQRSPDAVVLRTGGRAYDYGTFVARAAAVAAALRAATSGRGARVALLLEEYDGFFVSLFGCWLAGRVAVPLNTSLPARDLARLVAKSAPEVLLTEAALRDQATAALAGDAALLLLARDDDGRVAGVEGARAPSSPPAGGDDGALAPDDLAMIMFTSGTTGVPKGVCQTLAAVSGNAGRVALRLGLRADDRIFINTPPYFTSGICHFLTMMANGGGLAGRLGFFFGAELLEELAAEGCTGFGGAPAHLVRVVEPLEEPRRTALRFWVSSGDHLPVRVIERFRALLPGVRLFNMYGLTEVSGRLCILPPEELDRRVGSVGWPIEGMAVVARSDDGAPLPPGETGELYVTGPLVMQGYLDEPGITARTLTAHGLRTGDFGHLDDSGAVWVEGRQDDIIKRGGEKVSIVQVQQALQGLGRFADVAVIAAPDDILGHVPVAFVVPREREGFKAARVLRELRAVLPPTSLPSRIVAVDAIPRTGSGKAVRAELQAMLAEASG